MDLSNHCLVGGAGSNRGESYGTRNLGYRTRTEGSKGDSQRLREEADFPSRCCDGIEFSYFGKILFS